MRTKEDYTVVNDTYYAKETPAEVIRVLENARQGRYRIHLSYGYTTPEAAAEGVGSKVVGEDWLEEHGVTGYVGRSMGPHKIPLMVFNERSYGGGGILTDCIVRIRMAAGGRVLYQHPQYSHGKVTIHRKVIPVELPDGRRLTVEVHRDGEEQAAFEDMAKARHYIRKLGLKAEIVNNLEAALA